MIYLSLLLSLFLNDTPQSVKANFDWLIGTWAGIENNETEQSFEVWEKIGEGVYEGIGYSLENGDTTFVEKLSIADIYGVPHYTADVPGNNGPVSFVMIKVTKSGFICANLEHDFPKQIEYQFEHNDLKATISGDGKSKTFTFQKN